jgi:hypothetical protein
MWYSRPSDQVHEALAPGYERFQEGPFFTCHWIAPARSSA